MKKVLENLSVALGHKGEINETVQKAARNMLASGMDYAEINAYADAHCRLYQKIRKNLGNY